MARVSKQPGVMIDSLMMCFAPVVGLGCNARVSEPMPQSDALALASSLRDASSFEIVCVAAENLDRWLEDGGFRQATTIEAAGAWELLETLPHVEPSTQARISELPLPPVAPRPEPPTPEDRLVRVVALDCTVGTVMQRLVGPLATAGLRHAAYIHDAVHRDWRERFDAHLVFLDAYSMRFDVRRPADTHAQVRRVVWEHYVYCDGDQHDDLEATSREHCRPNGQWSFLWD